MKDNLPEDPNISWPLRIREIDTVDPVLGGAGGIDNLPHQDLADRTVVLRRESATKTELKTHADLTAPHSATAAATANRLIIRDASGRAQVADPSDDTKSADIVNKRHLTKIIDALEGNVAADLDTHVKATAVHGATPDATASRIVMRDASGNAKIATPTDTAHISTKGYVDTQAAARQAPIPAETSGYLATHSGTAGKFGTAADSSAWQKSKVPAGASGDVLTASGTAGTFGTPIPQTTFSKPGHQHDAADITSGTLASARLPKATAAAIGAVQLGTITDGNILTYTSSTSTTGALGSLPQSTFAKASHNHTSAQISDASAAVPTGSNPKNVVIIRDTNGRAQVNDPSSPDDIATKRYVDNAAPSGVAAHEHAASEITSGTLASARLPTASPAAHGAVKLGTETPDAIVTYTSTSGTLGTLSKSYFAEAGHSHPAHQHPASDITDGLTVFAAKAHQHPASDVNSGTLDPARLPTATASAFGAVQLGTQTSGNIVTYAGGGVFGSLPQSTFAAASHTTPAASTSAVGHVQLATIVETAGAKWHPQSSTGPNSTAVVEGDYYYNSGGSTYTIVGQSVQAGYAVRITKTGTTGSSGAKGTADASSPFALNGNATKAVTPQGLHAATADLIVNIEAI